MRFVAYDFQELSNKGETCFLQESQERIVRISGKICAVISHSRQIRIFREICFKLFVIHPPSFVFNRLFQIGGVYHHQCPAERFPVIRFAKLAIFILSHQIRMVARGANCLTARGGEFVNGLHPHIHKRVHAAPDDFARLFVKRLNLVSGLDVFNRDFVVHPFTVSFV